MLRTRTIVAAVLLPAALIAIYLGGLVYAGLISILLLMAAWEHLQLLKKSGYSPAVVLSLALVLLIIQSRYFFDFNGTHILLTGIVLISFGYHLLLYERGSGQPGGDLGATLSVPLYIGWLGAYLISLRNLPGGMWWSYLILPIVWFTDTGAYLVGKQFGSRPLCPRLSPKKTWEGYLGGILAALLGTVGLVYLFRVHFPGSPALSYWEGLSLGLIISSLIPLGDLAESMLKRQAGVKDSGKLLPGHGGMFDRLDTVLWALPLGYYLITHLFPLIKKL
jgi:phosphatidate cytidylyltransferase